jgi:hypothetical protein
MIKKISITALILIIASIISANIWHAEVFIFKNNVQKYTALNIHQNTGIHRKILTFLQAVSTYLPSYPTISKAEISEVFGGQYNVQHSKVGDQKVVNNVVELKEAIATAIPGDVIMLADGEYEFEGKALNLGNPKYLLQSDLPIVITSLNFRKSKIRVNSSVGFKITYKNWIISDIVFEGVCDSDARCEHAIHIVGDADNLQILGNDFVNFNAAIKSNGIDAAGDSERLFPDFVFIQSNRFYNQWPRETTAPVTPIDVVGGEFWTVANNFIADFSRNNGRKSNYTYGAFLKGDSKHGIFNSNFVACAWQVPYFSALDQRVGISFGGGGTGDQFCASGLCEQEHKDGLISDNVIVNCTQSASIYVNDSKHVEIANNVLIGSAGIEISRSSDISVKGNSINGKLRKRNESTLVVEHSNQYFRDNVSYAEY